MKMQIGNGHYRYRTGAMINSQLRIIFDKKMEKFEFIRSGAVKK